MEESTPKHRAEEEEEMRAAKKQRQDQESADEAEGNGSEGVEYSGEEEEEEEEEPEYEGERNGNGEYEGQGTLRWPSGNVFRGNFKRGAKCGPGKFKFADGSSLEGVFSDDLLNGRGVCINADGSKLVGTYVDGDLDGPATEYDVDGKILFKGTYKDNARTGVADFFMEGGGRFHGPVGDDGEISGPAIYFYPAYPHEMWALQGTWEDGEMVDAKFGSCTNPGDPASFQPDATIEESFRFDTSDDITISTQPLLSDRWEESRVYVKDSPMPGAGEGLFAKIDIGPNEVVSFYNGVRLSHDTVDNRDWLLNSNTISLDDDEVIDVPSPYDRLTHYRASLGHKANHCFENNAVYDTFTHPRFGPIKCVRSIQPIKKDEEITVLYGYEHETLPEWYQALLAGRRAK